MASEEHLAVLAAPDLLAQLEVTQRKRVCGLWLLFCVIALVMLESLWKINGVAEAGRDAAWYTNLLFGLQGVALVFGESWTVKMRAFLHSLHLPLISIEVIDVPAANRRLFGYLHRWDNVVLMCTACFLLLFITNIVWMQMKTILKAGLLRETKRSFLWIFCIILLCSEERGIVVGIFSGEGMILDDGRGENY